MPPEVTEGREEGGRGGVSYSSLLLSSPLLFSLPLLPPSLSSHPSEEFVVFCPITELQETIYCAILDCEDVQLILHSGEPCNCYRGSKRGDCCYRVSLGVHTLYSSTPLPLFPSPHLPLSPSPPQKYHISLRGLCVSLSFTTPPLPHSPLPPTTLPSSHSHIFTPPPSHPHTPNRQTEREWSGST